MTLSLDPESIVAGTCATLSWQVVGAEAVFLQSGDGPEQPVSSASALSVCPTAETLYSLRAVAGAQQERRTAILEVLEAETSPTPTGTPVASTSTPTPPALPPTAESSPSPTVTPLAPPAPVLTVAATPTAAISGRPVPVFTPAAPTPAAGNPARFFVSIGAFALVLAGLLAAGAWALFRQRHE